MSSTNLSLYNIETELLELLRFREDVATDADMTPAEQAESLKTVDVQIEEYIRREVQKADGVAAYVRECDARAAALKAEAARVMQRAGMWADRRDRLKAVVLRVMQLIGKKKTEGRESTLAVRKNPTAVDVRQPGLVPEAYQRVTVTIDGATWAALCKQNPALLALKADAEVSLSAVKEALKRGEDVPGCQLDDERFRLEIE